MKQPVALSGSPGLLRCARSDYLIPSDRKVRYLLTVAAPTVQTASS